MSIQYFNGLNSAEFLVFLEDYSKRYEYGLVQKPENNEDMEYSTISVAKDILVINSSKIILSSFCLCSFQCSDAHCIEMKPIHIHSRASLAVNKNYFLFKLRFFHRF